MMDKYSNVYIGLVVNNSDPKQRGRVQVFIPHITNTLYKGWNDTSTDKKFRTLDSDNFPLEIVQKLMDILPWAEVAMPFFGGGTGAPIDDTGTPKPIPTFTYGSTGGIAPSTSKPVNHSKHDGINRHDGRRTVDSISSTSTTSNSKSNPYGLTNEEILFAMRIAASETGAGVSSKEYTLGQATNFNKAKTLSGNNYLKYGLDGVDIGYTQANQLNVNQSGQPNLNNGSYKDQIISTALYIRQLSTSGKNKDPKVLESIQSGDFTYADDKLGSKDNKNTIGTKYYGLLNQRSSVIELEDKIKIDYNQNVIAALDGINSELPPTGTINEIAQSGGDPMMNNSRPQRIIAKTTNSFQNVKTGTNSTGVAGGPIGISSIPQIGSKAYVMFLDGNPLQPIVVGCYKEPTNA